MAKKAKDGILIMRIDSALKAKAYEVADSHGMSLSQYVEGLITQDVGRHLDVALAAAKRGKK